MALKRKELFRTRERSIESTTLENPAPTENDFDPTRFKWPGRILTFRNKKDHGHKKSLNHACTSQENPKDIRFDPSPPRLVRSSNISMDWAVKSNDERFEKKNGFEIGKFSLVEDREEEGLGPGLDELSKAK